MNHIYVLMVKYVYLHKKQVWDSCFHPYLKIKAQSLQTNIFATIIQKVFLIVVGYFSFLLRFTRKVLEIIKSLSLRNYVCN